jgi:hypothetical protein
LTVCGRSGTLNSEHAARGQRGRPRRKTKERAMGKKQSRAVQIFSAAIIIFLVLVLVLTAVVPY